MVVLTELARCVGVNEPTFRTALFFCFTHSFHSSLILVVVNPEAVFQAANLAPGEGTH